MKRYIKIYLKLLHLSWASLIMYRANFINSIISANVWCFFNLLTVLFLTAKTSSVLGWSREELILLIGVSNIVVGIFYFLFSISLYEFANIVNLGTLDAILLKPIDSQFALSLWIASFQSLARVIFGIGVTTIILVQLHISPTPLNILIFLALVIFSTVLQYTIWFGVTTITIKFTTLSNINELLYHTNDFTRFPPEMFRAGRELLYFILFPFTLIAVVPVKTLLQKATIIDIFWLLLVSCLFFYLSRKFFQFTLRFYTSASG